MKAESNQLEPCPNMCLLHAATGELSMTLGMKSFTPTNKSCPHIGFQAHNKSFFQYSHSSMSA